MAQTCHVNLSVDAARQLIVKTIEGGSVTGSCIDEYRMEKSGGTAVVMVFEKYYMRVSNRMTLTVIIDDFDSVTRVHCVSGGGGQGALFRFDWFAGDSFASAVDHALQPYII